MNFGNCCELKLFIRTRCKNSSSSKSFPRHAFLFFCLDSSFYYTFLSVCSKEFSFHSSSSHCEKCRSSFSAPDFLNNVEDATTTTDLEKNNRDECKRKEEKKASCFACKWINHRRLQNKRQVVVLSSLSLRVLKVAVGMGGQPLS